MDKTVANIMIKKGHFEIEDNGTIATYMTYVMVDDESTEVVFCGESKSTVNMVQFRDHIADIVAKYRRRGKIVNPYSNK